MKFAKHLKERLDEFETEEYREWSLPYKTLKKSYITSSSDNHIVEQLLLNTCMRIDSIFKSHWELAYDKRKNQKNQIERKNGFCGRASCFFGNIVAPSDCVNPKELVEFAALNSLALYKICKKLHKRRVAPFDLYYKLRNQHRFAFMGSGELTLLKLMLGEGEQCEDECPICFDENPKRVVVMTCGHWVCWTCLGSMTKINSIKGTLSNRLLNASLTAKCPVCRERDPLRLGKTSILDVPNAEVRTT